MSILHWRGPLVKQIKIVQWVLPLLLFLMASGFETIEHIYSLSGVILAACEQRASIRSQEADKLDFKEMRKRTLNNLMKASEILKMAENLEEYPIIFTRGERSSEYPFWHLINGPIADAIYHTGQVVAYRRASGNPLPPGVRVLTGKTTVK